MSMLGDIAAEIACEPLQKQIDDLSKQRDELLKALRDAYAHITLLATGQKPPRSNAEASEAAGAAIASAEGGAA